MAHNLNINEKTGKASFFSVKEKAWHGLGTIVEDYPTSTEALEISGLNFEVGKKAIFAGKGKEAQEIPGKFATFRKDTNDILGVVGSKYEILQNKDAFLFFDSIVEDGSGIMYETAGALGKGEKIFITAKLPGYIKVGKDDITEKFLFLCTSHDGSGAIIGAFTPVRIVCNNTLNAAMQNCTNRISIRHTKSAKDRLAEAHRLMGICDNFSKEMEPLLNNFAKTKVKDDEVRKLIQLAMAPSKEEIKSIMTDKEDLLSTRFLNICDEIFEYSKVAPDQQMVTTKNTLFGVYNAVTGFYQNVHNFKNASAKTESIIWGGAYTRAKKTVDICTSFAEKGNFNFQIN
jgi:phage/plasmid-like protein (TIGR03299 family)